MLVLLLLSLLAVAVTMLVQVGTVVVTLRTLAQWIRSGRLRPSFMSQSITLIIVLVLLCCGHLVQIACWALLFEQIGEFGEFSTAFYHSTVNFATLGYGDIVMSERWRLLGALQAASGVLMFGLSTGALLAVMSNIFRHSNVDRDWKP